MNPGQGTPVSLRPDNILRPCNFYATSVCTAALFEWARERGADPDSDLNLIQNGFQGVYASRTWKLIQDGITNGDPAPRCAIDCGTIQDVDT